MGTPLQHLYVMNLKWTDMEPLSSREKAAFSLICFVVSELNVLKRLTLLSIFDTERLQYLAPAVEIQRNLLLRSITAKLFELIKFIDTSLKKEPTGTHLRDIYDAISDELETHKRGTGYDVAKIIRNKMANHYDLDKAERTAAACSNISQCSLYLTEENGNCYYPLGDSLIFLNGIAEKFDIHQDSKGFQDAINSWQDWIFSMSDFANKIHFLFFEKLIEPLIPDKGAMHKPEWVSADLVADHPGYRLPIFVRANP